MKSKYIVIQELLQKLHKEKIQKEKNTTDKLKGNIKKYSYSTYSKKGRKEGEITRETNINNEKNGTPKSKHE